MNPADLAAIWLTCKLATITTLLLLIGTLIAWWLARYAGPGVPFNPL